MNASKAFSARIVRAFTLIEILVTLVILGIIAGMIVPNLGTRDDLKVSTAARTLASDLMYAQNLAIAKQQMHYVRFNPVTETYDVLSSVSPSAVVVTHPVEQKPFLVTLGTSGPATLREVGIESANFDGKTVLAFDEMGIPHAWSSAGGLSSLVSGSIQLKAGLHTMTVTVQPFTGEITVN